MKKRSFLGWAGSGVRGRSLDVIIVIGDRTCGRLVQLLGITGLISHIYLNLGGSHRRSLHESEVVISRELSRQPQEGTLKVVVSLSGYFEVLEILLAVECDLFGLDFSVLNINFIATKNDGNILANASEIAVPIRNTSVCDSRGDIKHDNGTLPLNTKQQRNY